MQTRCPECQTSFRVTPEQLKARAGKVRCGQCQSVFNALDSLVDAPASAPAANEPGAAPAGFGTPTSQHRPQPAQPPAEIHFLPVEMPAPTPQPSVSKPDAQTDELHTIPEFKAETPTLHEAPSVLSTPLLQEAAPAPAAAGTAPEPDEEPPPTLPASETRADPATNDTPDDAARLSPTEAQALGKATGLILPRETSEIPGYNKWAEGVMTTPISLPPEKPTRWPFVLATLVLLIALSGQLAYHFRGEIAALLPALRPLITGFSKAIGSDVPLPRHVAQISIETSDLQTDAGRGNLLVLNATVRNRAAYPQAFPALELALTDTRDAALVRKVFLPEEYLPGGLPSNAQFPAGSDVAVRLWLEARDVEAAGYRLYVFYP